MGYYNYENKYIESPKKQLFRIQIPYSFRFALIWTIVFAIVGITIQSISNGTFIFSQFFAQNYLNWFKSFGTFTNQVVYPTGIDVFIAIMKSWYYFFFTGGLISLIWSIVAWIINFELVVKKPNLNQRQSVIPQLPLLKEEIKYTPETRHTETNSLREQRENEQVEKMNEWLQEGLLLLSQGNIEEAEMIYNNLKQEYNPENDITRIFYRKILDFYSEIIQEKQDRANPKKVQDDWEG